MMIWRLRFTLSCMVLGWVLMAFTGCHNGKSRTAIRGNLSGASTGMIRLSEMDPKALIPYDSVMPDQQGKFAFGPEIIEPGFWVLQSESGEALIIVVHPGDHITVEGSLERFPDQVQVTGGEEAEALNRFYHESAQERQLLDRTDSILMTRQYEEAFAGIPDSLETVFREILIRQSRRQMDYLTRHPGYLSTILVVNYAFRMAPVMNYRDYPEWYHRVDSSLMLQYPSNKHVRYHHQRIRDFREKKSKSYGN